MIGIVVDLLEKKAFLSMVLLIRALEKYLYYQRIALTVRQWVVLVVEMIPRIVVDLLEKKAFLSMVVVLIRALEKYLYFY